MHSSVDCGLRVATHGRYRSVAIKSKCIMDEIDRLLEDSDINLEDVLSERNDLQVRFDATASQILNACNLMTVARE